MNDKSLQELYEDAKNEISIAKDIRHWNEIRETLKSKYPETVINWLGAYGFISEVSKKNQWK